MVQFHLRPPNKQRRIPHGLGNTCRRVKKLQCPKSKNRRHEPGEWEVSEDKGVYKILIRKCRYCGVKTNSKLVK